MLVACLALLLSCDGKDSADGPAKPDTATPEVCVDTWDSWADGFLRTWCTSCHSSELPEGLRYDAPLGIDFDTYAATVQLAPLIERAATGENASMPPVGGPSDAERQRLADWIACGMPGGAIEPAVCDEPVLQPEDVVVASADEAAALCAGANGVGGDLVVRASVDLSCLCDIQGDLVIEAGATQVELPNLASVGGSVLIADADLDAVRLPRLVTVGGDVRITSLPLVEIVDLSRLATVAGSLVLEDLPSFSTLSADGIALESVGGDLVLDDLDGWYGFQAFAQIETIGGTLRIHDNDVIAIVNGFSALRQVGSIDIQNNAELEQILGFRQLQAVDGDLLILESPRFRSEAGFEQLTTVGGALHLGPLPRAESFGGLRNVESVGSLVIEGTGLQEMGDWQLRTVSGDLDLSFNLLLADVTGLHGLESVGGNVQVVGNVSLGNARATALVMAIESIGGTTTVSGNGP